VARGTNAELLAGAGTLARAGEPRVLADALARLGHQATVRSDGSVHTDAGAALVGEVALSARLALTELRAADGAGLEEMFLELTADTQREGAVA
jgi:ABC-2 type transport system ATP-binding protein